MPATNLEGVVLAARNVGEHDRVYDLLSRGQGIVTIWHTQARRRRAGQAPALAPFASYLLSVRARRLGLSLLEATVRAERAGLRTQLPALARAGQLAHLVRAVWPPGEPADRVHDLLCFALTCLANGEVARASACYPRLVAAAGLMPDTQHCGLCRQQLAAPPRALADGSLACANCAPHVAAIAPGTWQALCGERVASAQVADELESVVVAWCSCHVGRNLTLSAWPTKGF